MRNLFFIPARAGSKGILNKNLQCINKVPLVERAIRFAQHVSTSDDTIVVSSDSSETLKIASSYNTISHKRNAILSNDNAIISDVVHNYIIEEGAEGSFDWVVLLEPTSPFRKPETFAQMRKLMSKTDCNSVITTEETTRVTWERSTTPGHVKRVGDYLNSNRQHRETTLIEANSFFAVRLEHFIETRDFFASPTKAVTVTHPEALDINVKSDLLLAKLYGETYDLL